jgi:hypothetical protein
MAETLSFSPPCVAVIKSWALPQYGNDTYTWRGPADGEGRQHGLGELESDALGILDTGATRMVHWRRQGE